jgi:hypothetical protein
VIGSGVFEPLYMSVRTVYVVSVHLFLGDHLKTGHTLSVQNRPTELAEDVIVLPCRSVFGQDVV